MRYIYREKRRKRIRAIVKQRMGKNQHTHMIRAYEATKAH
jgi:hypothetical protein